MRPTSEDHLREPEDSSGLAQPHAIVDDKVRASVDREGQSVDANTCTRRLEVVLMRPPTKIDSFLIVEFCDVPAMLQGNRRSDGSPYADRVGRSGQLRSECGKRRRINPTDQWDADVVK